MIAHSLHSWLASQPVALLAYLPGTSASTGQGCNSERRWGYPVWKLRKSFQMRWKEKGVKIRAIKWQNKAQVFCVRLWSCSFEEECLNLTCDVGFTRLLGMLDLLLYVNFVKLHTTDWFSILKYCLKYAKIRGVAEHKTINDVAKIIPTLKINLLHS